jgi:hypothetical protein
VRWVSGFFIGSQEFNVPAKEGLQRWDSSTISKIRPEGENAMGSTIVYAAISLVICVAYFIAVDHFLMDSQGLDFWYLFRK